MNCPPASTSQRSRFRPGAHPFQLRSSRNMARCPASRGEPSPCRQHQQHRTSTAESHPHGHWRRPNHQQACGCDSSHAQLCLCAHRAAGDFTDAASRALSPHVQSRTCPAHSRALHLSHAAQRTLQPCTESETRRVRASVFRDPGSRRGTHAAVGHSSSSW
jgi:hypothetical protein